MCPSPTVTVTILASDNRHEVISINSPGFLLKESTSTSGLDQRVTTMYVLKERKYFLLKYNFEVFVL